MKCRACLNEIKTNHLNTLGLLRLRTEVGDYFGLVDEDAITNWIKFMWKFKLIDEISPGQWRIKL